MQFEFTDTVAHEVCKQTNSSLWVGVSRFAEKTLNGGIDSELLVQLSGKALFRCFSGFYGAAGKFPFARQGIAGRTLCKKHSSFLDYYSRGYPFHVFDS
jgi:hypothetical protein